MSDECRRLIGLGGMCARPVNHQGACCTSETDADKLAHANWKLGHEIRERDKWFRHSLDVEKQLQAAHEELRQSREQTAAVERERDRAVTWWKTMYATACRETEQVRESLHGADRAREEVIRILGEQRTRAESAEREASKLRELVREALNGSDARLINGWETRARAAVSPAATTKAHLPECVHAFACGCPAATTGEAGGSNWPPGVGVEPANEACPRCDDRGFVVGNHNDQWPCPVCNKPIEAPGKPTAQEVMAKHGFPEPSREEQEANLMDDEATGKGEPTLCADCQHPEEWHELDPDTGAPPRECSPPDLGYCPCTDFVAPTLPTEKDE
jgi:hypothetical protein